MRGGLDMLGAAALSDQYITFRVRSIDRAKLRAKLGGATGELAAAGLHFVDAAPRAALDAAKPFIVKKMTDYGIDAEITVAEAPLVHGTRGLSEFWPGLGIGAVAGASGLLIWKLIARLIARR